MTGTELLHEDVTKINDTYAIVHHYYKNGTITATELFRHISARNVSSATVSANGETTAGYDAADVDLAAVHEMLPPAIKKYFPKPPPGVKIQWTVVYIAMAIAILVLVLLGVALIVCKRRKRFSAVTVNVNPLLGVEVSDQKVQNNKLYRKLSNC